MIRTVKNFAHLLLAWGANIFYGFPSRSLTMIGVTGTDGKTTTASLIYDILIASGKKAALLTTVSATIDGKSYDTGFHVTTPNAFALQKYLAHARNAGVKYFVLETTSHGLDQNRVFGIHFAVSTITNISNEHLDYHRTYEKYVAAKAKIMKMSDVTVLNKDDKSFEYLPKNSKVVTYGLSDTVDVNPHKYPLKPSMAGEFNLYNSLAALGVVLQLGINHLDAKKVIENYITPEGRQDVVQKSPYTIMIDFAHTPNSFRSLLSSLRKSNSHKIIHVFGSAGERDKEKRSEMGKISSENSDVIILTAEDPRGEKVEDIIQDISRGISSTEFKTATQTDELSFRNNQKYILAITDRAEAIKYSLSIAKDGDIVLITGKGHEKSMNFGNGEVPWSDHEVVKEILLNNR